MPRKKVKYEPKPESFVTTSEIDDAMAMLHGEVAVEFQASPDTILVHKNGDISRAKGPIKLAFSTGFRKILPKLRGPSLHVFISISLHVNEDGESYPRVDTICKETGYEKRTVAEAINHLKSIPGLLSVQHRVGTSNLYRPSYISHPRKK